MPVKSANQFRFMEAAANNKLSGMGGPSPAVAKEFLSKTSHEKKSKFAKENKKKGFVKHFSKDKE